MSNQRGYLCGGKAAIKHMNIDKDHGSSREYQNFLELENYPPPKYILYFLGGRRHLLFRRSARKPDPCQSAMLAKELTLRSWTRGLSSFQGNNRVRCIGDKLRKRCIASKRGSGVSSAGSGASSAASGQSSGGSAPSSGVSAPSGSAAPNIAKCLVVKAHTTGLPRNSKELAVEVVDNWPRLVSLAWRVDLANKTPCFKNYYVVSPSGYEIPQETVKFHGITTQHALQHGKPVTEV